MNRRIAPTSVTSLALGTAGFATKSGPEPIAPRERLRNYDPGLFALVQETLKHDLAAR